MCWGRSAIGGTGVSSSGTVAALAQRAKASQYVRALITREAILSRDTIAAVPRTLRLGMAALLLAVLVALGAYAARGWYSRYVTDDFCTAAVLEKMGFVEAIKFHRRSWSGRYSYYAAKAIPESIGPVTTRFMPGLMIALFGASAFWTLRRVLARQAVLVAVLAGAVVVYATIDGTFDVLAINGPLLWETGIITYTL